VKKKEGKGRILLFEQGKGALGLPIQGSTYIALLKDATGDCNLLLQSRRYWTRTTVSGCTSGEGEKLGEVWGELTNPWTTQREFKGGVALSKTP